MHSTESANMRRLRESQRRWAVIQAKWPRRNWLQLCSDHYDYLYPKP
jgi:hypothetical protein